MKKIIYVLSIIIFLIACSSDKKKLNDDDLNSSIFNKYKDVIAESEIKDILDYDGLFVKEIVNTDKCEGITIEYQTKESSKFVMHLSIKKCINDYTTWNKYINSLKDRVLGPDERKIGGLGDYACYLKQGNGFNSVKFLVSVHMLEVVISGAYGGDFKPAVPVGKIEMLKVARLIERRL
ncbi:hypothetical protein JXI42_03215 [bacterium]|nr:hypothetical protein [bacterium]